MEQADKLDKKIYVHCLAGVSRSTMVMAAFLMKKNKCSADSALNFIAKVNPSIDPNPHFLKGLSEWETFLKNGGTSG
jgi:protein-tyrosine phosphatase